MTTSAILRALALLTFATLSACGGGGGGGSGSADPGSATGLVPTAPAPGAVQAERAADLRPLRAGARWTYTGNDTSDGGAIAYTASITQSAGSGSAIVEATDNSLNAGPDSQSLTLAGGILTARQSTDFLGNPVAGGFAVTELRSPVRSNDQITLFDSTGQTLGEDIDGDRVNDTADVAAWSRVVGEEDVSLPALGRTLRAVRVDVTVAVRVKLSTTGIAQPVVRAVQSTWYAVGVGIVRRKASAPDVDLAIDERLTAWDGVTEGLGTLGPVPVVVPGPSYFLLPSFQAGAAVDGRALVVTGTLDGDKPDALTLAVISAAGGLVSTRELPVPSPNALNGVPQMVTLAGGAGLLVPVQADDGFSFDLRWLRFDADGKTIGAAQGTVLRIGADTATGMAAAADGDVLWVVWRRWTRNPFNSLDREVVLQAFAPDGSALAAPRVLDADPDFRLFDLRVAAAGGGALASWYYRGFNGNDYRYAIATSALEAPQVRTLGSKPAYDNTSNYKGTVPLLGSGVAALLWNGLRFSAGETVPASDTGLRGVTLDAAGVARRSTTGGLDSELLPSAWHAERETLTAVAAGDRLVVVGFEPGADQAPPSFYDRVLVSWLSPGIDPLADAAAGAMTLAVRSGSGINFDYFGRPSGVLVLGDRALIFGDGGGGRMMLVTAFLR